MHKKEVLIRNLITTLFFISSMIVGVSFGINPFFILLLLACISLIYLHTMWKIRRKQEKKFIDYVWGEIRIRNTYSKLFASVFTGIAAGIAVVFRDDIKEPTKLWVIQILNFFGITSLNLIQTHGVALYWLMFAVWLVTYGIFIFAENDNNKENKQKVEDLIGKQEQYLERLNSAIHRAPNADIFKKYIVIVQSLGEKFTFLRKKIIGQNSLNAYDAIFEKILKEVSEFTSHFYPTEDNKIFGANFMIYIDVRKSKDCITRLRQEHENSWIYYRHYDLKHFRGLLHTPASLVYSGSEARVVPTVTLGILDQKNAEPILGACFAVKSNWCVVNDVTEFDKQSSEIAEDSKLFFSKSGKDIKSIISIAIPAFDRQTSDKRPQVVGVLNIDCDKPFPLGTERSYYLTFYSLLTPIIHQLSPFIQDYAKLYLEKYKNTIENSGNV